MKHTWMEHIKSPEDFPEGFQEMAELIGVENALKVWSLFEGQPVYFFKFKEGFSPIWHALVRKKWKKHNIKELAKEFDVTLQTIRNIVNDHENQTDLFPCETS